MAWLAVNKDGSEVVALYEPYRTNKNTWNCNVEVGDDPDTCCIVEQIATFQRGTIEKILGYKLTWANDPVEV